MVKFESNVTELVNETKTRKFAKEIQEKIGAGAKIAENMILAVKKETLFMVLSQQKISPKDLIRFFLNRKTKFPYPSLYQ